MWFIVRANLLHWEKFKVFIIGWDVKQSFLRVGIVVTDILSFTFFSNFYILGFRHFRLEGYFMWYGPLLKNMVLGWRQNKKGWWLFWKSASVLRPGNTGNIFHQLATQHCCIASWKALLHVLPPTSNIVTQQNFVVASWSSMSNWRLLFSTNFFLNFFLQISSTCNNKFCWVTMF